MILLKPATHNCLHRKIANEVKLRDKHRLRKLDADRYYSFNILILLGPVAD